MYATQINKDYKQNVRYCVHIGSMNMYLLSVQTKTQREAQPVVGSAPFFPAVKTLFP